METVLSIAGSDPSAGAGIQQDLKVMTALGVYGATVVTALTTQNTLGVADVMPVPGRVVASQLQAVLDDLPVAAVKIGQIPDVEAARAVADTLGRWLQARPVPVVYDPVMVSTSGHPLMSPDCIGQVVGSLFPLCSLVTPNLPETKVLLGRDFANPAAAGAELAARFGCAFLVKGGHGNGASSVDFLCLPDGSFQSFESPRLQSRNLHGTGCALSSAIASYLAQGQSIEQAVAQSKTFLFEAIRRSLGLRLGAGAGPLLFEA